MLEPPARRPCRTCPYRRDVPSGLWAASEYARLPDYDRETGSQPIGVFQCHLTDGRVYRICAGWAGCHDAPELLSLRIAVSSGLITPETAEAACDYVSPVPLFASGAEAAAHGIRDIANPGPEAVAAVAKIVRVRRDLVYPPDPPRNEEP